MITEKKTIMIADDAEINRELLKLIFEDQFNVLEAEDGEQATPGFHGCCYGRGSGLIGSSFNAHSKGREPNGHAIQGRFST